MTLQLHASELAPLAAQALSKPAVEILSWRCAALASGGSNYVGGVGLYRVAGTARTAEGPSAWSMILKIASGTSPSAGQDPAARNYWRREALAYQSGVLEQLPGGQLVAPHCWGVQDRPNGEIWLWLEDIQVLPRVWRRERYHQSARHLGQFNGAYLAGYPLPVAQPWMTWGRTREWVEAVRPSVAQIHPYTATPLAQYWFGQDGIARALKLWAACPQLLTAFERLPVCYCHHDAHQRNLLVRQRSDGTPETVAIDWALTGFGRIGEEAGVTLAVTLEFLAVAASQAAALDQLVFSGYLAGLHAAGWRGDMRLARLGYTVNACLSTVLGNLYWLAALQTAEGVALLEALIGQPLDPIIDQWRVTLPFMLALGEEALALAALGFGA